MTELSLHILDIVQNSISAKANLVQISVIEDLKNNKVCISIKDNGRGMDEELIGKVADPFYTSRTTRKVGLGIPLFKQSAELCGGNLKIDSAPGFGTNIHVDMELNHIDRQPLGDIAGVLAQLAGANPEIEFIYSHQTEKGTYVFDTGEIKETLADLPISNANVIQFLKEMIKENLNEIKISI